MRKGLFVVILIMVVGFVCGLSRAADLEIILGTSSAFNIVRGTSTSSGTSTLYIGSSTVSIGTTTQSAMLYVVGSSTVSGTITAGTDSGSSIRLGTTTTPSSVLFTVGTTTSIFNVDRNGYVGIGTTTRNDRRLVISGSGDEKVLINATTASQGSAIMFQNTGSGNAPRMEWQFYSPDESQDDVVGGISLLRCNYIDDVRNVTNILVVTGSGTVGIGTTTPNFVTLGGTNTANWAGTYAQGTATVMIKGNLNVTGTIAANYITKYAGTFLIPHPDPAKDKGWMLRHSFVESPTRGDNLYRFKAVIQSDEGEAAIPLPSYWPHLNENPDVLVSPVGQFARGYGYVDESSNKLIIRGEKKGVYTVVLIGTRKDQYAKDFFDAKGVEYRDSEMGELLTRGEAKEEGDIQLINAQNNISNKTFLDPVADTFGLAVCQ